MVSLQFAYLLKIRILQVEARKEELEAYLSTNLVRREEELVAIISTASAETSTVEVDAKRQELKEAKETVNELTQQLKGVIVI